MALSAGRAVYPANGELRPVNGGTSRRRTV